jgi:uncharacterized protein YneF (UPF0154 family)
LSLYEAAHALFFYLPGVDAEMARLPTDADRQRARLAVWRRLIRSSRLWLLILIVTLTTLVAFGTGGALLVHILRSFSALTWSAPALLAWLLLLLLAGMIVGMWPIRTLCQRTLREHLRTQGLNLCLACGYDLINTPPHTPCPECGCADRPDTPLTPQSPPHPQAP